MDIPTSASLVDTEVGAMLTVTAYEVDDGCGAGQPILMGQWDYVLAVLRVGTTD